MVLIFVWFYALNQYVNLKGWGMKWKLNCTVYTIIMIFLDIPYLFLQILIIEKITWPGPSFHSPSLLSNKPLYMILLHLNQLFDLLSVEKNIMSFLFLYSTDNIAYLAKRPTLSLCGCKCACFNSPMHPLSNLKSASISKLDIWNKEEQLPEIMGPMVNTILKQPLF